MNSFNGGGERSLITWADTQNLQRLCFWTMLVVVTWWHFVQCLLFFQIVIWWFVSFLDSRELFSPAQKYQMLVYHADAIFHDKEYRNAACKYSMALQQKKVLSKTSKVRTSTGGAASNIQAQVCCEKSVHLKHFDWSCNTTCGVKDICHFFCMCHRFKKKIHSTIVSFHEWW